MGKRAIEKEEPMEDGSYWEQFARDDPERYIRTRSLFARWGTRGNDFFASGERDVDMIMDHVGPYLRRMEVAFEVGCGVGRLAIPMSRHFESVVAVDISPTMLAILRSNCERFGVQNVYGHGVSTGFLASRGADLVYSYLVFQHIEAWDTVLDYIRAIADIISRRGVALLQFDTRRSSLLRRTRDRVPDPLLPPHWRKGIRRLPRDSSVVRQELIEAGFTVLQEYQQSSPHHIFLLRKDPSHET